MVNIPLSVNDNGRTILIVLGVFLGLDYIFVFLRFWARYMKRRNPEANDWAILVSLAFVTALYISEIAAVINGGVGLHVMEIVYKWGGMSTIHTAGKLVLTADILWNMATLTIKLSILHLYITVFGITGPRFRRLVWILMGICAVSTAVFIIQILTLCRPLAFFWDRFIPGGKCGSLRLTYLIPGIIITVEDIAVFLLPLPLLWKLKMATTKKLGASFIFCIGLGICLMSGVRLKYVIELVEDDFTHSIWMFAILGTMEPMLGIISACLPVVPSIFAHYTGSGGDSRTASKMTGSAASGSRLGNSTSHTAHADFERLSDHDYPLIDQVKPMGSQAHAAGGGPTIKVTRQYEVDSYPSHDRARAL